MRAVKIKEVKNTARQAEVIAFCKKERINYQLRNNTFTFVGAPYEIKKVSQFFNE